MGIAVTLLLLIAKYDIHINATRSLTSISYFTLAISHTSGWANEQD
jgi:hypothetical protein